MRPDVISPWSQSFFFSHTELLVWKMESLHPAVPGFHTCEELLRCFCWTLHTPGLLCLLVSFPGPVSFTYLKRFEVIPPGFFPVPALLPPCLQNVLCHILPWASVSELSMSKPSKLAMSLAGWLSHIPHSSVTRGLLPIFSLLSPGSLQCAFHQDP